MDTKLKKFKGVYVLAYVIAALSATLCAVGVSITAAMMTIKNMVGVELYDTEAWIYFQGVWTGEIDGNFDDKLSYYGKWTIVCAITAVVALVVIFILAGKFSDKTAGYKGLNWFDRIWTELQLAMAFFTGIGMAGLTALMYNLWPSNENMLDVFYSNYPRVDYYGVPNDLAMFAFTAGLAALSFLMVMLLASIVKKMKWGQFLTTSLIVIIFLFVWKRIFGGIAGGIIGTVRGSDRTTVKMAVYMFILAGVEGFCGYMMWAEWNEALWLLGGIAFAVLWILLFIPFKVRKLNEIKAGAAEIRKGNLSHKIQVRPGFRGSLDELDRLAQDINHIGDAQKNAVDNELKNQRMKADLISNVSHDLKTPLTSMTAYIDLLKKEGLDSPNAKEYLDIIDQKTYRLKALTENLFEAAKASSGAIPVKLEEIDLSALVTQSLAEMESKLEGRKLSVIVHNRCEGCRVWADGQLLWRVLENLLGNVSKYAMEGSRVYLNMSRLDGTGEVLLEVKNVSQDPLNISSEELMERFTRGDQSRNTEGSGLGLAIARDLVNLMDGTFNIIIDGDLFKACLLLNEVGVKGKSVKEAPPKDGQEEIHEEEMQKGRKLMDAGKHFAGMMGQKGKALSNKFSKQKS